MYEYRRLSQEMQCVLVAQRRKDNLPLHEPPQSNNEENLYLFTGTNYLHRNVMQAPDRRDEFSSKFLDKLHR
jgi:hypothetical protein